MLTQELRTRIFQRDNTACRGCGLVGFWNGKSFDTGLPGVTLAIDHILPLVRGGTDEPGNLRVLCTDCNSIKGDRGEPDWNAVRGHGAAFKRHKAGLFSIPPGRRAILVLKFDGVDAMVDRVLAAREAA